MPTPTVKKYLFGDTAAFRAGLPLVEFIGTATSPTSRPTTSDEWLQLGWSIPTGSHAYVASVDAKTCELITERRAYANAITENTGNANAWTLLGVTLLGIEAALTDDARNALDDDEAEDLEWTVSVPGIGHRLYADDCLRRSIEIESNSTSCRAVAWAALSLYLERTQCIVVVNGDYVGPSTCIQQGLKADPLCGVVYKAFLDYLERRHLTGANVEGKPYSKFRVVKSAIEHGITADAALWGRLSELVFEYTDEVPVAERPVRVVLPGQDPAEGLTMVDIAQRAISIDPSNVDGWLTLTFACIPRYGLNAGSFVHDGKAVTTTLQCCVLAVDALPANVTAWTRLCTALADANAEGETSQVAMLKTGDQLNLNQCFQRYLTFDPTGYRTVAVLMQKAKHFQVELAIDNTGLQRWTILDLVQKAVKAKPNDASSWFALANELNSHDQFDPCRRHTVSIDDDEWSASEAFERTIELDPTQLSPWMNLAELEWLPNQCYVINGVATTAVATFQALTNLHIDDSKAWLALGQALIAADQPVATVAFQEITAKDCFAQSLLRNNSEAASWRELARLSPEGIVPLPGSPDNAMTTTEAFTQALRCSAGRDTKSWAYLGDHLRRQPYGSRSFTSGGEEFDSRRCWLIAIADAHPHIDAEALSRALTSLGSDMDSTETVELKMSLPKTLPQLRNTAASSDTTEAVSLDRREVLVRAIETATGMGTPRLQFLMRATAREALEMLRKDLVAVSAADAAVDIKRGGTTVPIDAAGCLAWIESLA